jgi:1,4-alpha-glucan branching enzyme
MKKLLLLLSSLLVSVAVWAQVYTVPTFITSETNETFYVYYDPAQSNPAMANVAECYAHTGVVTTESDGGWTHAPAAWLDNSPKYKMTKEGNLWKLEITDGLKAYYGLAEDEVVTKLAFVFRDATGSVEGKTPSGGDIFYDLFEAGKIAATIHTPSNNNLVELNSKVNVKGETSQRGLVKLTINGEVVSSLENENKVSYEFEVKNLGTTEIVITLEQEGNIVATDKVSIYVPTPVTEKPVPANFKEGINYHTDSDSITLVLRAPNNEDIFIIGDFNDWAYNENFQMYRSDVQLEDEKKPTRLFWRTFAVKDPTKKYGFQYLVDGKIKISDPYSEVVLDPWNDKYLIKDGVELDPTLPAHPGDKADGLVSVLEGPKAKEVYDWEITDFKAPEAKDLVIYELLVRDFHSQRTLQSVIDSLDYLKTLGINAIELMPVTEFDGNDSWGYNPNHFFAYDKAYGNRNLYKKFIDECHKNGIAVIIDMVFNHATGICPMAKLYWEGDATADNNPWFNRVAKHPFNVFHDINHEYEGTRKYFKRVLQYWVEEYKVDGYRMDLTKGFTQVNYGPNGNWDVYDASRIVILKDYCDAAKSINPDTYFIIEHLGGPKEETELVNHGILPWRNKNNAYCQAAMGWPSDSNFADSNDLNKIKTNQPNSLGGMFTDTWVGYGESHDEERNMYKAVAYGDGNLKKEDAHAERMSRVPAVIAFTTLIPGPKMMWQFQELGYDYSINYCSNGKIDEECRTYAKPVPWTIWKDDVDRWNAYRNSAKVISLRTKNPNIFRAENFTAVNLAGTSWDKPRRMDISYKDATDESENIDIIVLANFSATTSINTNANVPNAGTWYSYLTGEELNIRRKSQILTLKPGELLILTSRKLENIVSIDETLADENTVLVLPTIAENNVTVISKEIPSTIEVIDLSGNIVAKEFNSEKISIENLNKGHYIVRVLVDNNISTHRIIKK